MNVLMYSLQHQQTISRNPNLRIIQNIFVNLIHLLNIEH